MRHIHGPDLGILTALFRRELAFPTPSTRAFLIAADDL